MTNVTQILDRIADGEREAFNELMPVVYDELRGLAERALRHEGTASHPTELVHETYLRLIGNQQLVWNNRAHFFGACAQVIRRILVDRARMANAVRRGGTQLCISPVGDPAVVASEFDIIELDDLLNELHRLSPRQARLVELRFFSGMTEEEAAEVLGVSRRTISSDWAMARAWLRLRLSDDSPPSESPETT